MNVGMFATTHNVTNKILSQTGQFEKFHAEVAES